MITLEAIEFIKTKPLVTSKDIAKKFGITNSYATIFLERIARKGLVERIEKGKYTCTDDAIVVANYLVLPSYISFFTAASIKGYTEQIPRKIQIATTIYKKPINFRSYEIEFVRLPNWCFFGYSKEKRNNFTIFLVDDEKLIIDILLKPKTVGNFEEIVEIIKNTKIDESKMVEFVKRIKNVSLLKRLGYLLEKYKSIDISSIVNIKDKNYVSLDPLKKSGKFVDGKWRVKYD